MSSASISYIVTYNHNGNKKIRYKQLFLVRLLLPRNILTYLPTLMIKYQEQYLSQDTNPGRRQWLTDRIIWKFRLRNFSVHRLQTSWLRKSSIVAMVFQHLRRLEAAMFEDFFELHNANSKYLFNYTKKSFLKAC